MNRRGFLKGMAGILAAGAAPAVLPSGIIMPVRALWTPPPCGMAIMMDDAVFTAPTAGRYLITGRVILNGDTRILSGSSIFEARGLAQFEPFGCIIAADGGSTISVRNGKEIRLLRVS